MGGCKCEYYLDLKERIANKYPILNIFNSWLLAMMPLTIGYDKGDTQLSVYATYMPPPY